MLFYIVTIFHNGNAREDPICRV